MARYEVPVIAVMVIEANSPIQAGEIAHGAIFDATISKTLPTNVSHYITDMNNIRLEGAN